MLVGLNAWRIALFAALLCCVANAHAQAHISLTASQRAAIWRHLGKEATDTSVPAGLHVGEAVPDTMRLLAFARRLRKRVPAIRHYSYALLQGQVLIVDPRKRRIVSIVSGRE